MKTLKLDHMQAISLQNTNSGVTWRLFDDKDINVNDVIELVDKGDGNVESYTTIGSVVVDQVVQKRLADITDVEIRQSGVYESRDQMFELFRKYYGADVAWKTPVKMISFSFRSNNEVSSTTKLRFPDEVRLYTDGGSRGNPGPSAAGFVVYDTSGTTIYSSAVYLGVTTNNQAEYLAVKLGLELCLTSGARLVHVYMDSLLVVNQMNHIFKVKNRELWPLHDSLREIIAQFDKVQFTHVPRELNKEADAMVNKALDDAA